MMNGKIDQLVGSMVRPIAGSLLVAGALFCFGLMSGHAQTVDPISADDSAIEVEGSDHRFKIFGSERLASIESRTLFEKTNTNVNHGQAQALSRRVYEHFHDDFDFIIFASNQSAVPAGSYYGRFYEAQNKIEGVGKRQFDNTSNFGSQGRLQGVIHLTSTWGLTGGPSLHEITHKWGNDMASVPTDVGSHWGYSNIGGQLGGWQPGSLVELGDNKYKARNPNTGEFGSWGSFANGGNGLPYSEFELYTMGLIEASEVGHDIKIAKDFIWVEPGKGIFSASSINTVTMDEVIEIDGLRSPGPSESQKQFRILYVILTDKPLTLSQWQSYDEDVSNFQIQEDNGSSLYNFWEATRGLASLKMDELAKSVKVKNAYTIRIDPNTNIALDSTIGAVGLNGSVWDWYSNDTPSDPRNSLSVFLAEVRNSETHLMLHDGGEPGVLTQTSGGTTSDYNYNGIPGDDNDASARGVILKYKATAERTLLIETAGGENNNSVVVIFTETHLDNGEEPFKVVTHDSTDQTAFKVRFPYSVNNPSDNIYYIGLTSYNSNDLNLVAPIKITADPLHPVIELSADSTEVQWAHTTGVDDSGMQYDLAHPIGFKAPEGMTVVLVNKGNRIVHDTGLNEVSDVHQYLVDVGDQDGRGFASMFYMTSYGHAWDYWKSTYVAKAGEDGDGDGVADNLDVFPNDVIELSADGTEIQWAHTTGINNSGMRYDMAHPIGFKAPAGMTVVLVNKGEKIVHDTGLNEVSDVHQYLVDVGDQDGKGLAAMYYMSITTLSVSGSDGGGELPHVWDYWENTYVAKASVDGDGDGVIDDVDVFPNDASEWSDKDGDGVGDNSDAFPMDELETVDADGDGFGANIDQDDFNKDVEAPSFAELSADGTEVRWAHTTGIKNSRMRYDMAHPIGFKAPAGMTVVLVNKVKGEVHDTGLNEVSDLHQYLLDVGDQDRKGLAGMWYMTSNGDVWDNNKANYVAKAVRLEGLRLSLSGLNLNYDGNEKNVTVTTEPSGLNVVVTYTDSEGSAVTNPINAGTYTVTATISDANYDGPISKGSTSGVLKIFKRALAINKAQAGITVSDTSHTYDGSAKKVTVTTDPAGLNVVVSYINSEGTAVSSATEVGKYAVVAKVSDVNYKGSASRTLTIAKGSESGGGNEGKPVSTEVTLTYKVEDNSVTIKDCETSASGVLVIPSSYQGKPVTSIGDLAFEGCSSLASVIIPDSVTSIGGWAFEGCSSLASVIIPDSVTSIGESGLL